MTIKVCDHDCPGTISQEPCAPGGATGNSIQQKSDHHLDQLLKLDQTGMLVSILSSAGLLKVHALLYRWPVMTMRPIQKGVVP